MSKLVTLCALLIPIGINVGSSSEHHGQNNVEDLYALTENEAFVQVIVDLKSSNNNIPVNDIQNTLIRQLVDLNAEIIKQYHSFPILVLRIDREALEHLLNSSIVKTITLDEISKTMNQ